MEALHDYFKNVDAGFKTSAEFTPEQRKATIKTIKDAEISAPILQRKGETITIALRSKTKNVVVSIKNVSGLPIGSFTETKTLVEYRECSLQMAKDDALTLVANQTERDEKLTEVDEALADAMNALWLPFAKDMQDKVKGTQSNTLGDCRVAANACVAYSFAVNTMLSHLLMDGMENEENEGIKLCYANRAKIFHEHAQSCQAFLRVVWGGLMEMKCVVV